MELCTSGSVFVKIGLVEIPVVSQAKRRVIDLLALRAPVTAPDLAIELDLTGAAIRQHLADLENLGLVQRRAGEASGRGRPSESWSLSDAGRELLPNRHAELAVEMIRHVRSALGSEALEKLIASRQAEQCERYRIRIGAGSTRSRLAGLAQVRSEEGYVAEFSELAEGWLFSEHHCPICDAAAECQSLCRGELATFQELLGADVIVTRSDHLLSGESRCTYLVKPVGL